MPTVLVHDLRLAGDTPTSTADASIEVDATTPINGLISAISNVSDSTISRLLILCHGYESTSTGNACIPMTLGFGLQLAMEDLTLRNVGVTAPLYGSIQDIILYACGPANTTAATKGTYGDGQQFCRELASYTGANVYASDTSQAYHNLNYDPVKLVCETIPIDFGDWEGNVYRFSPDGSVVQVQ
jgi:hypothetical protein